MAGGDTYAAPPGVPEEPLSPTTSKGKMIGAVLQTSKETGRPDDLAGLTRKAAFESKLASSMQLEEALAAVSKLEGSSAQDDLAKFRKTSDTSAAAQTKAATAFVNKSTNAAWIPTLIACQGRAWPGQPMIAAMVVSIAVTCVELLYLHDEAEFPKVPCEEDGDNFSDMCRPYTLQIPSTTVTTVGGALFFLMVFRTNASYDRWWEGRKRWGMVINRTRDFARQTCTFVDEFYLTDNLVRWTVAFAYCMKRHLRFERDLSELDGKLDDAEIAKIQEAKHMPLYCLERMSTYIRAARESPRSRLVDAHVYIAMDMNLTQFEDELGACERILKTPFPFAYVIHLRTFMSLWLFALPFALLDLCGWLTIPTTCLVAYALLGIETIGVEIENPSGHDFNDLPLDTICQTIETNLFELLARRVKSLAESANDRSVLSARADEAYATLATDGSSTSISGGGAVVAIGALTKAVITVLEGVALRESEVRGLLLRAEREADAECLARMSDTSGADSKVEMGGGAADLLSVCQMVAREKAA